MWKDSDILLHYFLSAFIYKFITFEKFLFDPQGCLLTFFFCLCEGGSEVISPASLHNAVNRFFKLGLASFFLSVQGKKHIITLISKGKK